MSHCLFFILTPAYNSEKYIKRCIDSIINQTFLDWEMNIIDDGSNDSTLEIITNYARKDRRIKVVHQDNKGYVLTNNRLLTLVQGDYKFCIDSDNWLGNNFTLENVTRVINKYHVDIVHLDYLVIIETILKKVPGHSMEMLYMNYENIEQGIKDGFINFASHQGMPNRRILISNLFIKVTQLEQTLGFL